MNGFFALLKTITTEDDANKVFDPVRLLFIGGGVFYMCGGAALIIVLLHAVWFLKTPPDFQSFGIGIAAWGAGFGAYLAGGGTGLMAKAHGDALTGTVTEVTETKVPPAKPIVETKTTTTKAKKS